MNESNVDDIDKQQLEGGYIWSIPGTTPPLDFPSRFTPTAEFGCSIPITFVTSEGLKTMQPGKSYDENLNEITSSSDPS